MKKVEKIGIIITFGQNSDNCACEQVLNLFLALLLSSFGAESLKHSQEDSEPNKLQEVMYYNSTWPPPTGFHTQENSEPNKLQEAVDRINRLVIYFRSKLVQLITERCRNTNGTSRSCRCKGGQEWWS